MKSLITSATIALTAFTSVDSHAGGCRIAVTPHHSHVTCQQVLPCDPPPPPAYHQNRCELKPSCRIRVCERPPIRCTISHYEPQTCSRCHAPVCHCHERRCRIKVCEPVTTCRIICEPIQTCRIRPCEPVHTCRIRPCEPVHPGYETYPEPAAPAEPAYVAPGATETTQQLPEIAPGQEVTIEGRQFGMQPGTVAVKVGGLVLQVQVTSWTNQEVRAVMPNLPLTESASVQVAVLNAQGQLADQLAVVMLPQNGNLRTVAQR